MRKYHADILEEVLFFISHRLCQDYRTGPSGFPHMQLQPLLQHRLVGQTIDIYVVIVDWVKAIPRPGVQNVHGMVYLCFLAHLFPLTSSLWAGKEKVTLNKILCFSGPWIFLLQGFLPMALIPALHPISPSTEYFSAHFIGCSQKLPPQRGSPGHESPTLLAEHVGCTEVT